MLKVLTYCTLTVIFCAAASAQDLSSRKPVHKQKVAPEAASVQTQAATSNVESFNFNFGAHTEFYNNIQIDDAGSLQKFDPAPVIGAGFVLPMSNGFRVLPEINWVLPQEAGSSKITKNLFMLRADIGYDPLDWLRIRLGTSLMWLNQHATGGSTKVKNGNSTSTFYYPDENRSSINNTLDLGLEAMLDAWSFRLQTYTYSVFKEEQRQVSYSLFISYYWDQ